MRNPSFLSMFLSLISRKSTQNNIRATYHRWTHSRVEQAFGADSNRLKTLLTTTKQTCRCRPRHSSRSSPSPLWWATLKDRCRRPPISSNIGLCRTTELEKLRPAPRCKIAWDSSWRIQTRSMIISSRNLSPSSGKNRHSLIRMDQSSQATPLCNIWSQATRRFNIRPLRVIFWTHSSDKEISCWRPRRWMNKMTIKMNEFEKVNKIMNYWSHLKN